jgi:hypothetical protein
MCGFLFARLTLQRHSLRRTAKPGFCREVRYNLQNIRRWATRTSTENDGHFTSVDLTLHGIHGIRNRTSHSRFDGARAFQFNPAFPATPARATKIINCHRPTNQNLMAAIYNLLESNYSSTFCWCDYLTRTIRWRPQLRSLFDIQQGARYC